MYRQFLCTAGAVLMMMSAAAQPKPSYSEARKITNAVTSTLSVTMRWDKKTDIERLQAIKAAMAVRTDAERVFGADEFGPYRYCLQMASRHADFVQTLNAQALAVSRGSPVTLFSINEGMTIAYNLGELYRSCRDTVEQLDVSKK